MRFLWSLLDSAKGFRPSATTLRRLAFVVAFAGCVAAAFWYGRQQAPSADANVTAPTSDDGPSRVSKPKGDYENRVVAEIHGSTPITRADLGEFLIERFGADRVEFLVNRKILEKECAAKKITVSDAEVEAQLREDVNGIAPGQFLTPEEFEKNILKRFNKTIYEWKEDVIRPKLLLAKMCRPLVKVSEEELKNAFEAKYGPRVQVRIICFLKDDRNYVKVYNEAKASEEKFNHYAKNQAIDNLRMTGGVVPPFHKHFDPVLSPEAFALKVGEVSKLIEMSDGSRVMMKCDKHIPADATKTYADVRLFLEDELKAQKLAAMIPEKFSDMRKAANAKVYLKKETLAIAPPPPLPPKTATIGAPTPLPAP
ncbi:MAG: peptidyl-prolyl cis-trans isomerase [Gemmataceae bacterium]